MVVKANNSVLHKIETNHFLQSIEWTARRHDPRHSDTWQVTIEAEEAPLTILHLDTAVIDSLIETRPDLHLVIECLVAKDVSIKMYMMNKMIGDTDGATAKKKEKKIEKRLKSSSMDAINTGWKGLMRSYFWSEFGSDGRSENPINEQINQQDLIWPNKNTRIAISNFS